MEIFTIAGLTVLLQVIAIDLVLAGDNAIVIGLAAAGLTADQRNKAIIVGILAATVLRICFALIIQWLLAIGSMLLIIGGLLLLWVCLKMWRELSISHKQEPEATEVLVDSDHNKYSTFSDKSQHKTFTQAIWQIIIADVSMSLDNVLAVAGAAVDHPTVLIIGLVLSITLMGFIASFLARLLHRYRWISYIGLIIIFYVAVQMLLDGTVEQFPEQFWFLSGWLDGQAAPAR